VQISHPQLPKPAKYNWEYSDV